MTNVYTELIERYRDIEYVNSIRGVLKWDYETTLPSNASEYRSEQFKFLNKIENQFWFDPKTSTQISECLKNEKLDQLEKRNIEILNTDWLIRQKIPETLTNQLITQSQRTNKIWKQAKQKKEFSFVVKELKDLFKLNVERAGLYSDLLEIEKPFDALIATRDAGFDSILITKLFDETKSFLIPMVKKYHSKSHELDLSPLSRTISRDQKINLARAMVKIFKYSPDRIQNAEIGEVEHPLTIACGPNDVRLTVKYAHWEQVMSAAAHEVGHGIHRLNRKQDWYGTPVYTKSYPSLAECISRYTENKIGKSRELLEFYYPTFQSVTHDKFKDMDFTSFYQLINRVIPGPSRMSADEISYGLHIIIRFEIEKDLFDEKIEIQEVAEIWNEKYENYLGVKPANDTEGVMQDLHWFSTYWGYFQGYALGDIMGSQIQNIIEDRNPDWKTSLREGDFSPVYNFLSDEIFQYCGYYTSPELVKKITGKSISTDPFKKYLSNKFSSIFG